MGELRLLRGDGELSEAVRPEMSPYKSRTVVDPSSLPPGGPHYLILVFSSEYVPGDERSRTNPGHGYPAYYQQTCHALKYETKGEWEAEIVKRTREGKSDWVALEARRPTVEMKVSVEVG